jgi:hypothetical protein
MKLRSISTHWYDLIKDSSDILHDLDLAKYNRKVTDRSLVDIICPFVGSRPRYINMSNCFHVTDEGFGELAKICGPGVRIWRMKSVWDITGPAVLEMVQKAKSLEEVDLSNCRKVGDNLLARVIGWVVPDMPPQMAIAHAQHQAQMNGRRGKSGASGPPPQPLPPGTVVGCPKLTRLTLSYCKHITDRSMAHIAVHAANRIESIDLTRCTTITDVGFQHWSVYPFPRLTKLVLADCTYLTDNAIVYLTNAAKGLKELDLVSETEHEDNNHTVTNIVFSSHSAAPSPTQQQKSSPSAYPRSLISTSLSVAPPFQILVSAASPSISSSCATFLFVAVYALPALVSKLSLRGAATWNAWMSVSVRILAAGSKLVVFRVCWIGGDMWILLLLVMEGGGG